MKSCQRSEQWLRLEGRPKKLIGVVVLRVFAALDGSFRHLSKSKQDITDIFSQVWQKPCRSSELGYQKRLHHWSFPRILVVHHFPLLRFGFLVRVQAGHRHQGADSWKSGSGRYNPSFKPRMFSDMLLALMWGFFRYSLEFSWLQWIWARLRPVWRPSLLVVLLQRPSLTR